MPCLSGQRPVDGALAQLTEKRVALHKVVAAFEATRLYWGGGHTEMVSKTVVWGGGGSTPHQRRGVRPSEDAVARLINEASLLLRVLAPQEIHKPLALPIQHPSTDAAC
jgi:hypothetical protein